MANITDIPGYYYDEQRNRYFLMLESAPNPEGDFFTDEWMFMRALEETVAKKVKDRRCLLKSQCYCPSSLFSYLMSRELGTNKTSSEMNKMRSDILISNLDKPTWKRNWTKCAKKAFVSRHGDFLFVWYSGIQEIEIFLLRNNVASDGQLTLDIKSIVTFPSSGQILDVTMVNPTTVFLMNHYGNIAQYVPERGVFEEVVRVEDVLSFIAYSSQQNLLATGHSRGFKVFPSHPDSWGNVYRTNSDVRCGAMMEEIEGQTSPILLCGTKRDGALLFDLRNRKRKVDSEGCAVPDLSLRSTGHNGISSVLCLPGSSHRVVTCSFAGKMFQWDLRNPSKSVVEYVGLELSYMSPQLTTDIQCRYLCAAGEDRVSNVWDMASGRLVNVVAPEPKWSAESHVLPGVFYCEGWGKANDNFGLSGLLINEARNLRFYS